VRVLLDTHLLIWALGEPAKLSSSARSIIRDGQNDVLFSPASIWEIAIKLQLRRLQSRLSAYEIAQAAIDSGLEELPIRSVAAACVQQLPLHHRDPFDRILVAQAISEPARLLTVDRSLVPYSDLVVLV